MFLRGGQMKRNEITRERKREEEKKRKKEEKEKQRKNCGSIYVVRLERSSWEEK
jgi:hypothetical protein